MSYSIDLRARIVHAVIHQRLSLSQAAETFSVGRATVERYVRQYRQKGNLTPRTSPGRPRLLNTEGEQQLRALLNEKNDLKLEDRCRQWEEMTGTQISTATMSRWIKRVEVTRKKRH